MQDTINQNDYVVERVVNVFHDVNLVWRAKSPVHGSMTRRLSSLTAQLSIILLTAMSQSEGAIFYCSPKMFPTPVSDLPMSLNLSALILYLKMDTHSLIQDFPLSYTQMILSGSGAALPKCSIHTKSSAPMHLSIWNRFSTIFLLRSSVTIIRWASKTRPRKFSIL